MTMAASQAPLERVQPDWNRTVRSRWLPLAPPLPEGERSAREARRVRGAGSLDSSGPPHPNPLPKWGEGAHRDRSTVSEPLLAHGESHEFALSNGLVLVHHHGRTSKPRSPSR